MLLNWADWFIVGLLGVSCLFGLIRGFIKEFLSVCTWLAALFVATHYRDWVAYYLESSITTPSLRQGVAFVSLFVVTLLLGSITSYLLGSLAKSTGLSSVNRLLGVGFGLVRGLAMVMALLIVLPPLTAIHKDAWWKESLLIPYFLVFESNARIIASDVTQAFRRVFN